MMKAIFALAFISFIASMLAGWRIGGGKRKEEVPTRWQTITYLTSVGLFAVGGIYGAATGDPAGWLALALIPLLSLQGEIGGALREPRRRSRRSSPRHPVHE